MNHSKQWIFTFCLVDLDVTVVRDLGDFVGLDIRLVLIVFEHDV